MGVVSRWLRIRFKVPGDDYRPVVWPMPGPYWCSGYAGDGSYAVLVAFVRKRSEVKKFWPDAFEIEESGQQNGPITFSDRFPKPDYWDEKTETVRA